ncbi:MAG: ATP-dependent Clp protease adaptor ClpS [Bradymonadales bacterium]|jgi:ATP-dependent Clp protease adaptor protein ClpS
MGKSVDGSADVAVISKPTTTNMNIRKFKVILHNDDYTTFEFVIAILIDIFSKNLDEAQKITNHVHHNGHGVAGVYPKEIADTKVAQVHRVAEAAGFPLRATVAPA